MTGKPYVRGAHCGYPIRRDQRRKGYGIQPLCLALDELPRFGKTRALLTLTSNNAASTRAIETNGGVFAVISTDPGAGANYRRYWISLDP
ncbi:MAG: hypothetical protein JW932_15435 [Deltaproteobacteria bacterium]|nr:hypothetical protein [Deltaproteobacteria bacterium]